MFYSISNTVRACLAVGLWTSLQPSSAVETVDKIKFDKKGGGWVDVATIRHSERQQLSARRHEKLPRTEILVYFRQMVHL